MNAPCQHGQSADCLECEIAFRREYLAELEDLVLAVKRGISELVQRRPTRIIPINGRVEPAGPDGNVIKFRDGYWEGLGRK